MRFKHSVDQVAIEFLAARETFAVEEDSQETWYSGWTAGRCVPVTTRR